MDRGTDKYLSGWIDRWMDRQTERMSGLICGGLLLCMMSPNDVFLHLVRRYPPVQAEVERKRDS